MNDEKRDLEQIYHSAVAGLYSRIRSYYDHLYRRYGDDGLKLIEEMSREYGLSIAERAQKRLKDNDLESVANYLIRIFETVSWGKDTNDLIRRTPSEVVVTVHQCPLHFENPAMCLAHTTMERTVVETLNPRLRYRIGKSIPAGDLLCEHIVEIVPDTVP